MPDFMSVANVYQLLGFLIVAGLQVYTKLAVSKVAKQQEVMVAKHDASRAEMLRLAEHAYAKVAMQKDVSVEDVTAIVEAALRVSYLQGQADAGTEKPFPEDRIKSAAVTLSQLAMKAVRNGHSKPAESQPAPQP